MNVVEHSAANETNILSQEWVETKIELKEIKYWTYIHQVGPKQMLMLLFVCWMYK